jgi:hypothetical protein
MTSLVPADPLLFPIPANTPRFLYGNKNNERRIRMVGASGTGKTIFESLIAWLDWACFGLPTIVLDPHGTLIDQILGYIILQDKPEVM